VGRERKERERGKDANATNLDFEEKFDLLTDKEIEVSHL